MKTKKTVQLISLFFVGIISAQTTDKPSAFENGIKLPNATYKGDTISMKTKIPIMTEFGIVDYFMNVEDLDGVINNITVGNGLTKLENGEIEVGGTLSKEINWYNPNLSSEAGLITISGDTSQGYRSLFEIASYGLNMYYGTEVESSVLALKNSGLVLASQTGIKITPPDNASAEIGDVLTRTSVEGHSEWRPLPENGIESIVAGNGITISNSDPKTPIVTLGGVLDESIGDVFFSGGGGVNMFLTNPNDTGVHILNPSTFNFQTESSSGIEASIKGSSGITTLKGDNSIEIQTPQVNSSLAENGHILTLINSTTGEAEWLKPDFAPSSHNHDDRYYTESESDERFTKHNASETIEGAWDFTNTELTLSSRLYRRVYDDNNVYDHYYSGLGNGSNYTKAHLRVWNGAGGAKVLNFDGLGNISWDGNQIWHSGNFNPSNYLPLTGGKLSGRLDAFTGQNTQDISYGVGKENSKNNAAYFGWRYNDGVSYGFLGLHGNSELRFHNDGSFFFDNKVESFESVIKHPTTHHFTRLYLENQTTNIADTFSDTTTDKSFIYFGAGISSNDPGYIMHETSDSEINEGVLHLSPSDDNALGNYVSIHGTNDPDAIKLHTDGTIETIGSITASGNVTANSDKRLKKNIKKIPNALQKVLQLSGYTWDRKDMKLSQAGVIAQDVQKVLPVAVSKGDNGILSVDSGNAIPALLIEAIKELNEEVKQLKKEIKQLKSK